MQEKNQSASHFSERTDALAKSLGVSLRNLGPKMDLSTAMLFAYRSGKHVISRKAWAKLERAEIRSNFSCVEEPKGNYSTGTPVQGPKFEDYLRFIRLCRDEAIAISHGDTAMCERIMDRLIATWCMSQALPKQEVAEMMKQAEANVAAKKAGQLPPYPLPRPQAVRREAS